MGGWHHQLHGHEFQDLMMDREACFSPWGCKESYTTECLNWTDEIIIIAYIFNTNLSF